MIEILICNTGNLWSKFRAAYPNSLLSKKKKAKLIFNVEIIGTLIYMYVTWSVVKFISGIIERVIKLLQSSSEVRPLDVAKKCIGKTASKKDVNRYLHYLEKSGFVCVKYLNEEKKSNPVWSALPKARDITGIFILDMNSYTES